MRPGRVLASGCIALLPAVLLAGCAGAKPGEPTSSTRRAEVVHRARRIPAEQRVAARIDVSSDRIIAEGKIHIAPGAPSDAQVRRELAAARRAGIKLPSGESVASFEQAASQQQAASAEIELPETPWNPRHKPIAGWIVPVLAWASEHGWRGTVTSGYRTFYEQAQLNAAGAYSAPAGLSNHETARYPGGAVDVTEPAQLSVVLRAYRGPLRLVGGVLGPVDPEHFSATGY